MRWAFFLLLLISGVAVTGTLCDLDGTNKKILTINGFCDGFTIWKTGNSAFALVCPGVTPPAGAIEMREYYVVKPRVR